MDVKLLFWTASLLNFVVLTVVSVSGVRQIRRGDVDRHRRSMLTASSLVVVFLVSYALKLQFLGREDLSAWSEVSIRTLHFHELCVLTMVAAGLVALARAWRMRGTRQVTAAADDPAAPPAVVGWHRGAGRVAVVAAIMGMVTATAVLYGMYARS